MSETTKEDNNVLRPEKHEKIEVRSGKNCLYMDTIERKSLDFDFEKVCSVTLVRQNVYACLICGLFFNGRSKNTHAYFHSINQGHHIYINLETGVVYCLPDNYIIEDPSLSDIKHVLKPVFTPEEIKKVLYQEQYSSSLDGVTYIPGRIGINNLGNTDHVNAILQSLYTIPRLVEYFLHDHSFFQNSKLLCTFGEITRKFFNSRNFKGQISPQEFLLAIDHVSKGRFKIGKQSDPIDFLTWVLNELHNELKRLTKKKKTIVSELFKGVLECNSIFKNPSSDKKNVENKKIPYFVLSLDLPPTPLYRGEDVGEFIPQVPIRDLLAKYDGKTKTIDENGTRTFSLLSLPKFLILHIRRYIKNDFRPEKNPTIVNFPIKNLDIKHLLRKTSKKSLLAKNKTQLLKLVKAKLPNEFGKAKFLEKAKLISMIQKHEFSQNVKYDLVSNILHDGVLRDKGVNKAFVLHRANNKWYETQDLTIQETLPQLVTVTESYVQIWMLQE